MIARAVIGANFGDEGKGAITDYLVHKHDSNLVIRFNGGSQAGHTVQTPDGRRHVFSHFSSGSFAMADTLLSRFFIVNPMIFRREREELINKPPVNLSVKIDYDAYITTPFEMRLNQLAEENRGKARHGSCGIGINETIERDDQFEPIRARDLLNKKLLTEKLYAIRDFWVPIRKIQLGLTNEYDNILYSDVLINRYLDDIQYLLNYTEFVHDSHLIAQAHNPIFEGAQGLLLDQNHDYFPYVTRSNTGIKNVLTLMGTSYRDLEAIYVTRAYLTRHGAGPLKNELNEKPYSLIHDETNISNQWQGDLRFATLDLDDLKMSIYRDLMNNKLNYKIRPTIAITCLDQVGDIANFYKGGRQCFVGSTPTRDIGDLIAQHLGLSDNHFKSFGPTRDHVVDYMNEADIMFDRQSSARQRSRVKYPKKGIKEFA